MQKKSTKPRLVDDVAPIDIATTSKVKNISNRYVRHVLSGDRKDTRGVLQMLKSFVNARKKVIRDNADMSELNSKP